MFTQTKFLVLEKPCCGFYFMYFKMEENLPLKGELKEGSEIR